MRVTEGDLHELARLFMDQFSFKRDMSLDEFLSEYREKLTDDERNLGYCILQLFYETV
jgi:hypothetical protein